MTLHSSINKNRLRVLAGAFLFLTQVQALAQPHHPLSQKRSGVAAERAGAGAVLRPDSLKPGPNRSDKSNQTQPSAYESLVSKEISSQKGFFTVRHIGRQWYFEIPTEMIGRMFMVVTRLTSVPEGSAMQIGEEVDNNAVYFEKRDNNTLLLRNYVRTKFARSGDEIAQALNQQTTNPIVARFDVVDNKGDQSKFLIDVTNLFFQDNGLNTLGNAAKSRMGIGGLMSDRTFIDTVKAYPINIEINTLRTYATQQNNNPSVRSGYATIGLNTSIVLLPEKPMQPRLEDERVGYFTNQFTQFADNRTSEQSAIISRHRLEPKDPKAYMAGKLTEPKQQIVYYIDPATPKEWVPYLIKGIEDWNVAFEAAGFKNAIAAKPWPKDASMSVDDARYCVLRYIPSETQNAFGPRIVDPRSGEIIDSHICWYHNIMNVVRNWYMVQCGPSDKRARRIQFDPSLMGELLRLVSTHEVGHTLGLRHNMLASSATPVEKLRDKRWVESHGHTVSIMDYARFNYVAQPSDGITEKGLFCRIGDYDKWAVKWGYQWRPEFKDPFKEKAALRRELSSVLKARPELAFLGDEGQGRDPRSQTESVGDNNMKAGDYGILNLKRVMEGIDQWTAQPDGQYADLANVYNAVRTQFNLYCNHVQRNIGGVYSNIIPGKPVREVVPTSVQREAVDWLGRQLYEVPQWLYPTEIVDKTGFDAENDIITRSRSFMAAQLNESTLTRIDRNAQVATSPYPVTTYLGDMMAAVWKPFDGKPGRHDYYRRQMERIYLDLIDEALNPVTTSAAPQQGRNGRPAAPSGGSYSDVRIYLVQHVDKLEQWVRSQQSVVLADSLNGQHLADMLLRLSQIRLRYSKVD